MGNVDNEGDYACGEGRDTWKLSVPSGNFPCDSKTAGKNSNVFQEKIVFHIHSSQEKRFCHTMGPTQGSTRISQEAEREGEIGHEILLYFPQEKMSKAEQAGLGLPSLNNFS